MCVAPSVCFLRAVGWGLFSESRSLLISWLFPLQCQHWVILMLLISLTSPFASTLLPYVETTLLMWFDCIHQDNLSIFRFSNLNYICKTSFAMYWNIVMGSTDQGMDIFGESLFGLLWWLISHFEKCWCRVKTQELNFQTWWRIYQFTLNGREECEISKKRIRDDMEPKNKG